MLLLILDATGGHTENSQVILSDQEGMVHTEREELSDGLSLPSKCIPPSWLLEGAMNIGVNLQCQEEQGTFSFPSPPPTIPSVEMVHYYADGDCNSQFTQDIQ